MVIRRGERSNVSIFRSPRGHHARIGRTVLVVVSLAILVGCDPGYRYRPRGWSLVEATVATRSATIHGITFTTAGIAGLTGSYGIIPEFDIENPTERTLVLERAELQVAGGSHTGRFPSDGAVAWRSVEPRTSRRITISWEFEQPAIDVLGANPTLLIHFRLGDEQDSVTIVYERHQ